MLSKQRKAAGDKEGAAAVKALRKPTAAAWAINQLVRRDRAALDELLEVGAALRSAQRAALSGRGATALRELSTQRRQLVDAVVRRAVSYLGTSGDAQREAIATTLEAALASEEASAAVAGGRLEKPLGPPSGFGEIPGLAVVPDLGNDDDGGDEAEASAESARERRRAARAERRAGNAGGDGQEDPNDARRRELERRLSEKRAELERATDVARDAARAASAARNEVSRLQDELVAANGKAKHALDRARDLELARSTVQRELDDIDRKLNSL